jgi:membrane protein DedA with SNARE-associated domain
MNVIKGVLFVLLFVALAVGAFNLFFILIGSYFGPLYESEADQSRNFAIWLFGNVGVAITAVVVGIIWRRRRRSRI